MNEIHQRVFKIWGLINFNTKTLTLWLFYENSKSVTLTPRSPRGGDGADKNFRPISTIMPNMNEIHQRIFKIWGLINFNAKTLTLWRKDERTNKRTYKRMYIRTNGQTEKRKLYTPTYFVCRGYNNQSWNLTRGPRATIRSPEWHSHCRHADVMQHFASPIIATNENIIIWTVLSFEEEYMSLTVNGAWSFE